MTTISAGVGERQNPRRFKTGAVVLAITGLIACLAGCWTNGVHVVGNGAGQLKPGFYTSARPLVSTQQACEFRRYQSGKPLGNDVEFGGRSFIQILPTDTGVFSEGCGIWDAPRPVRTTRTVRLRRSGPTASRRIYCPGRTPRPAGRTAAGLASRTSPAISRPSLPPARIRPSLSSRRSTRA